MDLPSSAAPNLKPWNDPRRPKGDAARNKGRGAVANPPNRFDSLHYACDPDAEGTPEAADAEAETRPRTLYMRDPARRVLSTNQSPDVGFDTSLNPYRGCEHGCIYCYARPTHEYLGFSPGLDFETRILVKEEAPELLRRELSNPRWTPQVVALSGVTDPYQPVERRMGLTRRCLQVFAEFRNPIAIITKNGLVARDCDVLSELARFDAAAVNVSITSLDPELQRRMEPRASHPDHRLRAIERLAEAGIPVGVMVAPVVPGLTDHEIPRILEAAANAGATFAGMIVLRLPHAVKDLFEDWLERNYPDRKDKVMNRVRSLRGGQLNDPRFGSRMRGEGLFASETQKLFKLGTRRAGLHRPRPVLCADHFRLPSAPQLELF